jgi:hypothetical protein
VTNVYAAVASGSSIDFYYADAQGLLKKGIVFSKLSSSSTSSSSTIAFVWHVGLPQAFSFMGFNSFTAGFGSSSNQLTAGDALAWKSVIGFYSRAQKQYYNYDEVMAAKTSAHSQWLTYLTAFTGEGVLRLALQLGPPSSQGITSNERLHQLNTALLQEPKPMA